MRPWERWAFTLLALLVSATGVVYLWMQYGMTTSDPFAVVNHPLQPLVLHLHVMAAPWLILLFGILINAHVSKKLGERPVSNRRTGVVSVATFVAMTFSGYGLQVFTDPAWTRAMLVLHLASSGTFVLAYLLHLYIGLRVARDRRAEDNGTRRAA